jgi:hypothetical protein
MLAQKKLSAHLTYVKAACGKEHVEKFSEPDQNLKLAALHSSKNLMRFCNCAGHPVLTRKLALRFRDEDQTPRDAFGNN